MDKEELLELYEATGDKDAFVEAKQPFEQALTEAADVELLVGYGSLLMRRANFSLRQALAQYERPGPLEKLN
jgi:hypothetical protein